MRFVLYIFLIYMPLVSSAKVVHQENGISLNRIYEGLSVPWGMAFISPTDLLVTERQGRLLRINLNTKTQIEVKGLPKIKADGQGGLLDVRLGPNFERDGWIYFTYSKPQDGESTTALARAKLKDNMLTETTDLLVAKANGSSGRHFGSRITFDGKGHVFFGIGDRGDRDNGQDTQTHAATIIRLNLDGSVPKDNPFVKNSAVLNEIWSYGHRNPQGLVFDKKTQRLWAIEHGPRGGDEINLVRAGRNYGWPVISYGKEYWGPIDVGEGTHKEGMEQPVKYYVPSIAPGSLAIYNGSRYPDWNGNLFAGALKLTHLNRVELDKNGSAIKEERLFEALQERIRNVVVGNDDFLYIATDNGNIYQLVPTADNKILLDRFRKRQN